MSLVQTLREKLQGKPVIRAEHNGKHIELREEAPKENFLVRGLRGQTTRYKEERATYKKSYDKARMQEIGKKARYDARASVGSLLGAMGMPRIMPYGAYDPMKHDMKRKPRRVVTKTRFEG